MKSYLQDATDPYIHFKRDEDGKIERRKIQLQFFESGIAENNVLFDKSKSYFEEGEYDHAAPIFYLAYILKPEDTSLLKYLGQSYMEIEEFYLARYFLERYLVVVAGTEDEQEVKGWIDKIAQ